MDAASIDGEVRNRAFEVLAHELTLEQFEDWLVGEGWNERTGLVAEVDHLLVERSLLSDEETRSELRRIVSTVRLTLPGTPSTSLSNSTVTVLDPLSFGVDLTIRRHLAFAGT